MPASKRLCAPRRSIRRVVTAGWAVRITARSGTSTAALSASMNSIGTAVHPLPHVGGGDVAVTQHDSVSRELRADLRGQVVVAVGGHEAGHGVPGVSIGGMAGGLADPVMGGLRVEGQG